MIDTDALPILELDQGLSDEAIQTGQDSLGWSVWALSQAMEITTFPVEDVAAEMVMDPDYAGRVVEVFKMMSVERATAATRERIADEILNRLRKALIQANRLPAGDPLSLPIDYGKVGPCFGIHPDDVHCLRPDRR